MAWWQVLLAGVGGTLTAAATITTAAFAWKASTHATDKATKVQEQTGLLTSYDQFVKNIQAERSEDRARLERVESKLGSAEVRITALEAENRKKETLIGHLLDYVRRLLHVVRDPQVIAVLREHNIDVPEPPHEVRDQL